MTDQRPDDHGGARLPSPRHASGLTTPGLGVLSGSPHGGAHRDRAHRTLRTRLLWLLPVLVGAVVVIVLVTRSGTTGEPAATGAERGTDAPWAELARWADLELPSGTPLLVPENLLADATATGGNGGRFQPLGADVPGALLLVTGQEPPAGSLELARFGASGGATFSVVDPAPGQPSAEELQRRQRLSAAVLANPNTGAGGRAAEVLQTADIDARLLGLLAVLVAQLGVGVADFPPAAAEPADGHLARTVLIDRVGAERVVAGQAVTDRLRTFLDAQLPPFAPDRVEVTDDGVLVGFRYESAPDAVVTEQTP